MKTELLLAVVAASEYTGFEHTRIIGLLTVLAFISVAVWVIVGLSFIIRQCAVLTIRLVRYSRKRHFSLLKHPRRNHGA
jgi:isoprenylcysteine carboxyl methyltransferase (ICMT) family protein YpbQ